VFGTQGVTAAATSDVDEPEYSGGDEGSDVDGESSGDQPASLPGRYYRSSTVASLSNIGVTAASSAAPRHRQGDRRRQQVAPLSFVRKSRNRMLRPQLTSVSYTVRHEGRRRGRKPSRRPERRRKQPRRPRTTTPLPAYDGQTLGDFCSSGRLVISISAVMELSRCLGVDASDWLPRTTLITTQWSVDQHISDQHISLSPSRPDSLFGCTPAMLLLSWCGVCYGDVAVCVSITLMYCDL